VRFFSLASSSKAGSAYFIEGGDGTRVLVDCGPGIRRLEAGLWAHGVNPAGLSGVLITHGHSDHIRALGLKNPFTAKHRVPLYACGRLIRYLEGWSPTGRLGETHPIRPGAAFRVGGLNVVPFLKSHDCDDPLGFLIDDGSSRIAVVTDLGRVTREIVTLLRGSTYLIFESNHDVDMELHSSRPLHLIQRVLGDRGHLSNEQAGQALAEIVGPETRMVLLAHLSDECNTPELAYTTVDRYLDEAGYGGGLGIAPLFECSCLFSAGHTPRRSSEALAD